MNFLKSNFDFFFIVIIVYISWKLHWSLNKKSISLFSTNYALKTSFFLNFPVALKNIKKITHMCKFKVIKEMVCFFQNKSICMLKTCFVFIKKTYFFTFVKYVNINNTSIAYPVDQEYIRLPPISEFYSKYIKFTCFVISTNLCKLFRLTVTYNYSYVDIIPALKHNR